MAKQPEKNEVETTGHSWDGIEEFNNPLPKWWVYIFYACIVWAIGYSIAYPAWPGLKSSTAGMLGWSTRANVAADIEAAAAKNAEINDKLASVELASIDGDEALKGYAISAGSAVFKTWCAQCHGSGANGAEGYPSLIDNDWLWGGDIEAIYTTVKHGIRNDVDEDARFSEMPAFGDDYLEDADIDAVVNYVMSLSGEPQDASKVAAGAEVFANECVACHGEDGTGDRAQGAPNLTDAIWLYGGDYDTIKHTVTYSRKGVMPPRGGAPDTVVTEAMVRAVAVYVHQLGGGE